LSDQHLQFLCWCQSTIYSIWTDISKLFSVSEISADYFQFRCWYQSTIYSLCANIIRLFAVCVLISVDCLQSVCWDLRLFTVSVLILVDYLVFVLILIDYLQFMCWYRESIWGPVTIHSLCAGIWQLLVSCVLMLSYAIWAECVYGRKYMQLLRRGFTSAVRQLLHAIGYIRWEKRSSATLTLPYKYDNVWLQLRRDRRERLTTHTYTHGRGTPSNIRAPTLLKPNAHVSFFLNYFCFNVNS
jgi:uncharacterized membrane protein (DUF485 family)